MKWDQIESKWALMTRRIRADLGNERIEATEVSVQTLKRREPLTPRSVENQAFAAKEPGFKTSS